MTGGGSKENWEAKTSGRRKGGGSGENRRTNENDDYTTRIDGLVPTLYKNCNDASLYYYIRCFRA